MRWPWTKTKHRTVAAEDFFGRPLPGGGRLAPGEAIRFAPVYSAVRLIAESISSLSVHMIQKDGSIRRTVDHPIAALLESPNEAMTGQTFLEVIVGHVETHGEAFFEIVRQGGRPVALWPMDPARVTPERRGASIVFKVHTRDGVMEVGPDRLGFLKNAITGADGIRGVSPLSLLEKDLRAAVNARDSASACLGNGNISSGILKHPGSLSDDAKHALAKNFSESFGGPDNAGATILLDEGFQYQALSIDPEKAQLLQTRQFSISDIARIWRIPPHLLMDLSRSTFSNSASEMESFATHSLRPRLVRLEKQLNLALLSAEERRAGLSVNFNLDSLLRGSLLDRYKAHQIAIAAGFFNRNEVRQLENREAVAGLDEFLKGAPGVELAGDTNNGGGTNDGTDAENSNDEAT